MKKKSAIRTTRLLAAELFKMRYVGNRRYSGSVQALDRLLQFTVRSPKNLEKFSNVTATCFAEDSFQMNGIGDQLLT
ncbi:hypothetical protein [Rhodococcus sp. MALMAid1271]|uniref:hypothetical protein n=1 Tax=Rhodococcus sp. MALMAid1271 TaxID=3411744 RepID=UPI003BA26D77